MSRIGKKPIPVPDKVKVEIKPDQVVVTGPKGSVTNPIPPGIRFETKDKQLLAIRKDDSGAQKAFHGLARALVANAVKGVTVGFSKELDISALDIARKRGKIRSFSRWAFRTRSNIRCRQESISRSTSRRNSLSAASIG